MCLVCAGIGAQTKEEIKGIFKFRVRCYIHNLDGTVLKLDNKQVQEIQEHALVVVATGVDSNCDIWAIQWPIDYIVKTF